MHAKTLKTLAALCLILALAAIVIGLIHQSWAAPDDKAPAVVLPKDPRQVVIVWDAWRTDLPRKKEGPTLQIRADGSVAVTDPHGVGAPAEARLSAAELQELLRFAIHEQAFFRIDQSKLAQRLREERRQDGRSADGDGLFSTVLSLRANNQQHEIRYATEAVAGGSCPEARQLVAVQHRLERLRHWTYAGGHAGLATAVQLANKELSRKFSEAPLLVAKDLTSALQRPDGGSSVVLERYGVSADGNPFSFVHAAVERPRQGEVMVGVRANLANAASTTKVVQRHKGPWKMDPAPVAQDPTVKWDYPIVYVRCPLPASDPMPYFPNTNPPTTMPPGSELMILYPSGRQEILVPVTDQEAIIDPVVSYDAEWVYYAKLRGIKKSPDYHYASSGSDIFKVHVATRKIVQLTQDGFTPNSGAASAAKNPFIARRQVFNMAPCPAPGGKVVFTSDRNAFAPSLDAGVPLAQQLFVMNDDGSNVECIGHLNLGSALHPVMLKDGRVLFSTNETQGLRGGYSAWALWTINPDGAHWESVLPAFGFGGQLFHFMAQLSDERVVTGRYYPAGLTRGFGTYSTFSLKAPAGEPLFGPAWELDPRNRGEVSMSFAPYGGVRDLTLFATHMDVRPNAGLGNVAHPAAAPDNHLLTCWGGTAMNTADTKNPVDLGPGARAKVPFDIGIYLIKSGTPIDEPGRMLLVKNDPKYHEVMPRALVPYKRIYGVNEPRRLPALHNDGKLSAHLPEGTPYGLVGSSSLYKRESYPGGVVPAGQVTAAYPGKGESDPFLGLGGIYANSQNWLRQGADAGLYRNSDIHAIRIVLLEPVTPGSPKRPFWAHGSSGNTQTPHERFRILGEFPVRKFTDGKQSFIDPDGNPDTSFLAKLPADVAWTFQTLDKRGMVLNMAQTWHQLRPGEVRNDCGGCHAHSQKPTDFKLTAAARADYVPWDLTQKAPLLTTKAHDQTGKQWDANNETGVRFVDGITNVEFFRHVKPILDRSCTACHTQKWEKPAGNLVLDDDKIIDAYPGTYYRLARDRQGIHSREGPRFGHKPLGGYWDGLRASRYVYKLQSRRSLLIWKVFGERLDGWTNDDHPTETVPGDLSTFQHKGLALSKQDIRRADLDYTGSVMPPLEAVRGTYQAPDGKLIKVAPLTDEDKLTLVRWIDIGCPIDLDFNPAKPDERGRGFMLDEGRPTLTLTSPRAGTNIESVTRILIGMHDYDTGLDRGAFEVVADFAVDGAKAGENLAKRFKELPGSRWELRLAQPISELRGGKLTVSVRDRQGNTSRIERTFSVGK